FFIFLILWGFICDVKLKSQINFLLSFGVKPINSYTGSNEQQQEKLMETGPCHKKRCGGHTGRIH
ncbi:MAG: hypothetical protein ACNA7H_11795, partial [Desulfotignum sp.]